MEFELHTFKVNDFDGFVPQDMQKEEYADFVKMGDEALGWLVEKRDTVTIKRNDKTVAVMGVIGLPEGGGNVWLFFSKDVGRTDMIIANRMVKTALSTLKDIGYEWLQTPVRTDFTNGKRWAKHLGFHPTEMEEDVLENGIMYKYWMRVF